MEPTEEIDPLEGVYVVLAKDFDPSKQRRQLMTGTAGWTDAMFNNLNVAADKPLVVRDKPVRKFVTFYESKPASYYNWDTRMIYSEDMGDGTYRRLSDEEVDQLRKENDRG